MIQPLEKMVILLHRKDAFYNWLTDANRKAGSEDDHTFENDHSVYLVEPFYTLSEREAFLHKYYLELWQNELILWHDQELWPLDMCLDQFQNWFHLSTHREVFQMIEREGEDV